MLVDLIEEETTREQPHRVILHAGGSCSDGEKGTNDLFRADSTIYRGIPFGRARDCPTLSPRALSDTARDRRRSPHVRLAVVGMVMVGGDYGEDPNSKSSDYVTTTTTTTTSTTTTTTTAASSSETDDDRNDDENDDPLLVLITRRPSYMRSFPGAFVFPGGNLDEGESLADAVARELSEETGLAIDPDSWTLECLWESVYPTALPDLDGNEEEEDQEGAIRAHHLVCYFSGRLQRKPPLSTLSSSAASLRLCPEEVDGAVWLSKSDVSSLLGWGGTPTDDNVDAVSSADDREVALHVGAAATTMDTNTNTTTTTTKIPLSDLAGIYPRARGSGDGDGDDPNEGYAWCGMAQGSLFALEEFVAKRANTIFATENE